MEGLVHWSGGTMVSKSSKYLLDAVWENALWKNDNPVGPVSSKAAAEVLSHIGFNRALGLEDKSDLLPLLSFAHADWQIHGR
jgi:hypothetical protein